MREKSKYHYLSRLEQWRKERKLTQEELARAAMVGRTTIAALESGKRRAYSSTTRRLAKVLKVKPGDLI
jgi:transcriptional regulator with XRE-family HTH domain